MEQQFTTENDLKLSIIVAALKDDPIESLFRGRERKTNLEDYMKMCASAISSNKFDIVRNVLWDSAVEDDMDMDLLMLGIVRSAALSGRPALVSKAILLAKEKRSISVTCTSFLWNVAFSTTRSERNGIEHTCADVKVILDDWIASGDDCTVVPLPHTWGYTSSPCPYCDTQIQMRASAILPKGSEKRFGRWNDQSITEPLSLNSVHIMPDTTKVCLCIHFDARPSEKSNHFYQPGVHENSCPRGTVSVKFLQ